MNMATNEFHKGKHLHLPPPVDVCISNLPALFVTPIIKPMCVELAELVGRRDSLCLSVVKNPSCIHLLEGLLLWMYVFGGWLAFESVFVEIPVLIASWRHLP